MSRRLEFTKGHGTGNDFVLVPDLRDELRVTGEAVRAVCDRRFGIGGDGLIRVVSQEGRWFMDYYNADGSLGEMCGNGARLFAWYLRDRGLVETDAFEIGTRGGVRHVTLRGELVDIDMGVPRNPSGEVKVSVGSHTWSAQAVFMPNPHAVVFVDDLADAGSLHDPPVVDSELFPNGQNVEFVVRDSAQAVRMRVHERGVGETLSCGTGICAVADRVWADHGIDGPAELQVGVPGGVCQVVRADAGSLILRGPVAVVADGHLSAGLSEMFL